MLKLGVILHASEIGGGERHIQTLLNGLDKKKFNITLICMTSGKVLEDFLSGIESAIKIFKLGDEVQLKINKKVLKKIWYLQRLYFFWNVYKYFKANHYDIIHAHNPYSTTRYGLIAKIAGEPVIISTMHGTYEQFFIWKKGISRSFEKLKSKIRYKFVDLISKRIIAVSQVVKESLNRDIRINENKIVVIYNGVAVKKAKRTDYRKILSLSENYKIVSMIGHLRPEKGHEVFIKSMPVVLSIIPDVKFIILGEGPCRNYLEELAGKINVSKNVIFLGKNESPDDIIRISDIVVLSSHSEGLPLSLIESASWSRVLVATDVGGVKEIVKDGINGYLVKRGDYNALAKSIISLLKNEYLLKKMSIESYSIYLKNFTALQMIQETEKLYAGTI